MNADRDRSEHRQPHGPGTSSADPVHGTYGDAVGSLVDMARASARSARAARESAAALARAKAERDRARDTAATLEAELARVAAVRDEWDAALTENRCPSCHVGYEANLMPGCDHAEGYHHALDDLSAALDWQGDQ